MTFILIPIGTFFEFRSIYLWKERSVSMAILCHRLHRLFQLDLSLFYYFVYIIPFTNHLYTIIFDKKQVLSFLSLLLGAKLLRTWRWSPDLDLI